MYKNRFVLYAVTVWLFVARIYSQEPDAITLLGQFSLPDSIAAQDLWGYAEPATGHEYALVGYVSHINFPDGGLLIVDVTDPGNPVQTAMLHTGSGFDIKVWQNYVYTVDGQGTGLGAIVDISDTDAAKVVGSFPSAHNIWIDDSGYMYLEMPGLRIFDLNQDPMKPVLIWSGGDQQEGHDAVVFGNRLFDFHGRYTTNIYDITDRFSPLLIGRIAAPFIRYHHSGWTSEDGRFLFLCDELAANTENNLDRPDLTVWDISNVANPELIARFTDTSARIHNLYIIGNYAYVSYYAAGFRVFDVSNPAEIVLVDEYDTSPEITGRGIFGGAFGCYPFTPSGNIYITDTQTGLFVFSFSNGPTRVASHTDKWPDGFRLFANYPNPFNPLTTIAYEIPATSHVTVQVINSLGQVLATIEDGVKGAGVHHVIWDGRDETGRAVASGVYFYRMRAGTFFAIKKLALLR